MTERQIWDYFKNKGMTDAGTAGLMGNLSHESGLRSDNLQNSYERSLGMDDKTYTAAVDSGAYGNFVHDAAGYGLAQWTYWSRKDALLKYAKARGTSIADYTMQLDFLMTELTGSYRPLYNLLCATNSVREASDAVMTQFERPADQSQKALNGRYQTSQGYYDRNAGAKDMKRSYSPLCNEIVAFGGRNSNPRLNEVSKITIHHMAGVMDAGNCARMHLAKSSSANYYIGNDGKICGGVDETRRAWTSGTGNAKGSNDHMAITIEVSNSKADNPWPVSDKAYRSLIALCADICNYYGIKPHYDGTKNGTLTCHFMHQATLCPGQTLRKLHENGQIERDIIAAMGQPLQPVSDEKPKQETRTLWRVQTGAFRDKDFAFTLLRGMRLKGIDGIVVLKDGFYKVQVGAYADKANAQRKAAELEAMAFDTFVTDKAGDVIAEKSATVTYTVKPGDTLMSIARRYNTTVARLVAANSIKNADRISVGQRLVIA